MRLLPRRKFAKNDTFAAVKSLNISEPFPGALITMDHTTAARTMAVEKYLLGEFAEEQDAFEEHFFSCDECAQEIKAGAALMKHGKDIFTREEAAQKPVVAVGPPKREWLAWLRPAFAVP